MVQKYFIKDLFFCLFLVIVVVSKRIFAFKIFLVARFKVVMSGVVEEKAIVIGALPIFETFKVDLSRLLFLGVVNAFAKFRNVIVSFQFV